MSETPQQLAEWLEKWATEGRDELHPAWTRAVLAAQALKDALFRLDAAEKEVERLENIIIGANKERAAGDWMPR